MRQKPEQGKCIQQGTDDGSDVRGKAKNPK